jgi:hypothetical protein
MGWRNMGCRDKIWRNRGWWFKGWPKIRDEKQEMNKQGTKI